MINKTSRTYFILLILVFMMAGFHQIASAQQRPMMVRISEIEINPVYLEEYKAILEEEAAASVKLEPRVIAIFPSIKRKTRHR